MSTPTAQAQKEIYSSKHIKIYDVDGKYMYCDWTGFQNKESVMSMGEEILKLVKQQNYTHVLNDNTHVTGPWQEASQWTSDVWFPSMFEAGLQKFAWVLSPNIFAELSAKKAMPDTDTVKGFNNLDDAREWLIS